jgi:thiamine-monophosphate kinase
MPPLSEHDLIRRYFAPLAGPEGLGLADDVALIRPEAGAELVVNTDMIAEGVHFLDDPPDAIAAKALRVNLSDLAAKGAEPFAYSLAIGLDDSRGEGWVASFAEGLRADQKRYGVRLIGGDTSRSPSGVVAAITAFGWVPEGQLVKRSGANPGDAVLVTGTIGDAALGLRVRQGRDLRLSPADADYLLGRFLRPEPRVALAPLLRRLAGAAIDVSDGLAGDLGKLCAASGAGARIEADRVPLSGAAKAALAADGALLEAILAGGDDYEILFTAAESGVEEIVAKAAGIGVEVTRIGSITAAPAAPEIVDGGGNRIMLAMPAFEHFAGTDRP